MARKKLPESYLDRLRDDLSAFGQRFDDLLEQSGIEPRTSVAGFSVVGGPPFVWSSSDAAQVAKRKRALDEWTHLSERLDVLFPDALPEVAVKLRQASDGVRRWLRRDRASPDFDVPGTIVEARAVAAQWFEDLTDLLDLAGLYGSGDTLIVVPDTSALLNNPDLATYHRALDGTSNFSVRLPPVVLSELDDIKDRPGDSGLKDKAQAMIRRIKGWSDRGALTQGASVTKTISVRVDTYEPVPHEILSWLRDDKPDDRLLASTLRIQSASPASVVILISSDINLRNRAIAAGLPVAETPKSDVRLSAQIIPHLRVISRPTGSSVYISLENTGQTNARKIEYSASSPPGSFPAITTGPWALDELKVGAQGGEQQLHLVHPDDFILKATWTDGREERQSRQWRLGLRPSGSDHFIIDAPDPASFIIRRGRLTR